MAIWQFDVDFRSNETGVRRSTAEDRGSGAGRKGMFQRDDADLLRVIDGMLVRRKSWSENLVLWGEENGNRIDIFLEEGKIANVNARIDLRQPSVAFLELLLKIARYCGAHFRTEDELDIPAEKERILEAIRHSEAFRFVSDPQRFFEELKSK